SFLGYFSDWLRLGLVPLEPEQRHFVLGPAADGAHLHGNTRRCGRGTCEYKNRNHSVMAAARTGGIQPPALALGLPSAASWLGTGFPLHRITATIRYVSAKIFGHVLLAYRRNILCTRQIIRVLRPCNLLYWIHPERTCNQAFRSSHGLLCYPSLFPNSSAGVFS